MNNLFMRPFLFFCLLSVLACAPSKRSMRLSENDQNFTFSSSCTFIPDNKENTTGILQCKKIKYRYTYDYEVGEHPKSDFEAFRQDLRYNGYKKLLDYLNIDEKVHRLFIDSIRLISLHDKAEMSTVKSIWTCQECNRLAIVSFKGKNYNYPYYSTIPLQRDQRVDFTMEEIDHRWRIFTYRDRSAYNNGIIIEPIKNAHAYKKLWIYGEQAFPERFLATIKISRVDY
jgi:hypothetical protein